MVEKKSRAEWNGRTKGTSKYPYSVYFYAQRLHWASREEQLNIRENDHTVPLSAAESVVVESGDKQAEKNILAEQIRKAMEKPGFFTPAEVNYLELYLQGYNNPEIGQELGYTPQMARFRFGNIVLKLQKMFRV